MEDLEEAGRAADPAAAARVVDLAAADPAMIVLPTPAMAADLGEAALVVGLVAVAQATTILAALARVADLAVAALTAMVRPRLEPAADLEERVPAAARAGRAETRARQMRLAQFPTMLVPTAHREGVLPAWAEATMRSQRRWPNSKPLFLNRIPRRIRSRRNSRPFAARAKKQERTWLPQKSICGYC